MRYGGKDSYSKRLIKFTMHLSVIKLYTLIKLQARNTLSEGLLSLIMIKRGEIFKLKQYFVKVRLESGI